MKGKKVLILGGSGGIGKQIVDFLLNENMLVINLDKSPLNLCSKNYEEIVLEINHTNIDSVITQITMKHNSIYALICAIGFYGVNTLDNYTKQDFYHTMFTNVEIPTLFSIELSKTMRKNKQGKMIFISSAAAYVGSRDIPYSISKAALLGLVRGLGKNLKETGIYVYGVAPGIVETQMSNLMSQSRKADAVNATFDKRVCRSIEVARLVRFLLIEDDGYMNGSVVHINDGLYLN